MPTATYYVCDVCEFAQPPDTRTNPLPTGWRQVKYTCATPYGNEPERDKFFCGIACMCKWCADIAEKEENP